MTRMLPSLFLLFLLPVPPLAAEEDPLAAPRKQVAEAEEALGRAKAAMEEAFVTIRADFDLVRSPDWGGASAGYVEAVREASAARGREGTDLPALLRETFRGCGLLSETVADRLAAAAAAALTAAEGEPDPAAILAGAVGAVFPAEAFADVWDRQFQDLAVVLRWREANDALARANEALKAAETPATPPEKPAVPPGMVLVPKGRFEFGPWTGWLFDLKQNKQEKVRLEGYFIDVHEVTNAGYLEFLSKLEGEIPEGYVPVGFRKMEGGTWEAPAGEEDLPARGVIFAAAAAYAEWAGKRLPTEEEWEKAARGEGGQLYPWGNDWDAAAANTFDLGLAAAQKVGTSPKDRSAYGVFDLSGNVSEFTSTLAGRKPAKGAFKGTDAIVIRGGNYHEGKDAAAATYRWTTPAIAGHEEWIGFRCVITEKDWK